jgi:acyl-CoA synthetase (AMP-forming)/AMP-acid ligase II
MHIGTILHHHATRHPERPAVIFGDQTLSFHTLDSRSNQLANALIDRGLKPGDRVILYVGNSLALVEAIAAVWKAGGVTVPITPWIVGPELAFMVGDCQPFAILYGPEQTAHVDRALADHPEVRRTFIGDSTATNVTTLDSLLSSGSEAPPPRLPADATDAVIGYTSGTTGHPKGAVITHTNLITNQLSSATSWGLALDDVWLVSTPIAHRVGLSRTISCFCLGATLVVMPRFTPAAAIDLIVQHRVTALGTVPTVCRLLLEAMEQTDYSFDSLRFISATGEAFPIALKQRLAVRLPQVQLVSCYASTEGGVIAALLPHEQFLKPASVGRPMPGMEIRVVDAEGRDVPEGRSGELLLRSGEPGRGLIARGYFNRPEANSEAFTDAWFHTGDVGYFDAEGYLYLVDRVKDMILSGGLNIYSREVEQTIEALPGVREVAVVAGPDADFGECVVAYVACRPGMTVTAADILAQCREQIASYKKPKHIIFVEQLPRNVNGKVVKTELRQRAAQDMTAPTT